MFTAKLNRIDLCRPIRLIAKRGQPNTPQAGTWVSLEPGYRVLDKDYPAKLVVERDGKIISD